MTQIIKALVFMAALGQVNQLQALDAKACKVLQLWFLADVTNLGLSPGDLCEINNEFCAQAKFGEALCKSTGAWYCQGVGMGEGICRAFDAGYCTGATYGEGICRAMGGEHCAGSTLGEGLCRSPVAVENGTNAGRKCVGNSLGEGLCRAFNERPECTMASIPDGICQALGGPADICLNTSLAEALCYAKSPDFNLCRGMTYLDSLCLITDQIQCGSQNDVELISQLARQCNFLPRLSH